MPTDWTEFEPVETNQATDWSQFEPAEPKIQAQHAMPKTVTPLPTFQAPSMEEIYGPGLREPTLGERLRTSPVATRLLGPPVPTGRGGAQEIGVLPVLTSAPIPFAPAPESVLGKALLSYFVGKFAVQQPEIIPQIKDAYDKKDWETFKNLVGEEAFGAAFTGLAIHGLGKEGRDWRGLRGMFGERFEPTVEVPPAEAGTARAPGEPPRRLTFPTEPPQRFIDVEAQVVSPGERILRGRELQRLTYPGFTPYGTPPAPRLPRPVVPEGPIEPPLPPTEAPAPAAIQTWEDFVRELKKRPELTTIGEVQKAFPELQLNREAARRAAHEAFGEEWGVEKGPRAIQPSAEGPIRPVFIPPGPTQGPIQMPAPPAGPEIGPRGGAVPDETQVQAKEPVITPDIGAFTTMLQGPPPEGGRFTTEMATSAGLKATSVADLDHLAKLHALFTQQAAEAKQSKDLMTAMLAAYKRQLVREAIEAATNTGSHVESDTVKLGPRPLDWTQKGHVGLWMVENAEKLGIKLPELQRYGVPLTQWWEMAKYNDAEQMKRWGTTRSKLLEQAMMGQPPPAAPEPPLSLDEARTRFSEASRKLADARLTFIIGEPREKYAGMTGKNKKIVQEYWDASDALAAAEKRAAPPPPMPPPAAPPPTPAPPGPTIPPGAPEAAPPTKPLPAESETPIQPTLAAAREISDFLRNRGNVLTKDMAHDIMAKHHGGTMAEGKFTSKDQSDVIEMAVNQLLASEASLWNPAHSDPAYATSAILRLKELLSRIPTQTTRTAETDKLQQFSTVPTEAFAANWVANIRPTDVMLESSIGIGGLAVFAKNAGAVVIGNELSKRRLELVRQLGLADHLTNFNAEQLHAIYAPRIAEGKLPQPTVVVMNPPFSSAAMVEQKTTMVGAQHVEEALKLLPPGGRLVAIVGRGMEMGKPTFVPWWRKIAAKYNVRANITVSGKEYQKYGTAFDNQMLVIDNSGPTPDLGKVVTGKAEKVEDLIPMLESIRNDRPPTQPAPAQPGGASPPPTGGPPAPPRPSPPRPAPGGPGIGGPGRPSGGGLRPPTQVGPGLGTVPTPPAVSPPLPPGPSPAPRPPEPTPGPPGGPPGQPPAPAAGGTVDVTTKPAAPRELSTGIFTPYVPAKVNVPGAPPHPAPLVESTAMAAVEPVDPTYKPSLTKEAIAFLSNEQIENIVYAGQSHEKLLPNGDRQGYFIGDGTGVGKGSQLAGIFLDNMLKGREKGLWVTAKTTLLEAGKRDFRNIGMDPKLLIDFGKSGGKLLIGAKKGIGFVSYDSLARAFEGLEPLDEHAPPGTAPKLNPSLDPQKPARIRLFHQWVGGSDFDGVIAFDESHYAGNAVDMRGSRGVEKASQRGRMVVALQALFPKARIVYASATGATDVTNLGYGDRLGIWGPGTPFPNKLNFMNTIAASGLSAMEIVARDLKATGKYLARTLSFEGIQQDQLAHNLTPDQVALYDEVSRAWQLVLSSINSSMAQTGMANSGFARGQLTGMFWGAELRFYNQLLTSMQTPTIIGKIQDSLAKGNSVLIQLTNTNEATLDRELAKKGAEADEGNTDWLEDLDLTPKQILLEYIDQHYPTQKYAPVTDDHGNTRWEPQWDPQDPHKPLEDPAAKAAKQELMDRIKLMRAPSNPIEMILDTFGEENVAEITGRSQRVVKKLQPDGTRKEERQPRTTHTRAVEHKEFNDDKRRILIFSAAGGTGFDYHSGRNFVNQRQRDHIGAQMGWQANAAIQGLGRSNRTNQANVPHYWMPSTDIPGHKRFISTIMRRLAELGAMTGGERRAAAQELFKDSDDLENAYAHAAVMQFFTRLFNGEYPNINFSDVSRKMGFTFQSMDPHTGEMTEVNTLVTNGQLNQTKLPAVHKFLNRVLILEKADQERVFKEFDDLRETIIDNAKAAGSYDPGTQQLKALAIRKVSDQVVYSDPNSTAKTRLVDIEYDQPVKLIPWEGIREVSPGQGVVDYVQNIRSGRVFALKEGPSRTMQNGSVVDTWRRISPTGYDIVNRAQVSTADIYGQKRNYQSLNREEAQALWADQLAKAPKIRTHKDTYVVGAFLPIWDRLQLPSPRIWQFKTDKGENILGAHVPTDAVEALKDRLGAGAEQVTPKVLFDRVLDRGQSVELANGWTVKRSRVQGDYRIEVRGVQLNQSEEFQRYIGGFMERIAFEPRFFIPTDEDAALPALERLLKKAPVVTRRPPGPGGTAPPSLQEQASQYRTTQDVDQSKKTQTPGGLIAEIDPNQEIPPLYLYSGIPIPISLDQLRDLASNIASIGNAARAFWRGFAMKQAPKITAADRESGESGVRYAASTLVARDKGLIFASKVLAGITDPAFDTRLGAGISEDNLRDIKQRHLDLMNEVLNRDELIRQAKEEIENYRDDARAGDEMAKAITRELRQKIARLEGYEDEDAERFKELADGTFTFIGAQGSPFPTEAAYRDFMNSPEVKTVLERHRAMWKEQKDPLYRLASDLDPDAPLESRGLNYGARVNLKPIFEKAESTGTTVGGVPRSIFIKQTATLKRKNPFSMRAEGQAPGYESSYTELMAHGFEREYPIAAQHEFLSNLLKSGLAELSQRESPPGMEIRGEATKGYLMKLRPWRGRFLQLPKSLASEYEAITGLSPAARIPIYTSVGQFMTRLSITGLAEGTTHVANLLSEMFTGLGPTANPLINVLLKSMGRADLLYRFPKILIRGFAATREEMLEYATMGATKQPYRGTLGWFLNKIDQGSRLVSAEIYKGMAEAGWVEDSETGLREFVNQLGNYNKKLQPVFIRWLRDTHVQPFATAMQTFNVQGLRRLALAPGVSGTSLRAKLALHADIAAGLLGLAVVLGFINYLISGRADGPKGTKLGAVGWIGDDKKLHQLDVGLLTGWTRGARVTGLQAAVEAKRAGLTGNAPLMAATRSMGNTALSYVTGPLNRAGTVAITGKRPGVPMVQEAQVVPPQDQFSPLRSQLAENIATSLRTSTPLVDAVAGWSEGKPISEIAQRQASRFTPRTGLSQETIENLPRIVKASEINAYADALSKEARKLPILERWKFVSERMNQDNLNPELRGRAVMEMRKKGTFRYQ